MKAAEFDAMWEAFGMVPPVTPAPSVRPTKAKRKGDFVMVPRTWADRLPGVTGQTYALALELLYLAWRRKSIEFALSNKTTSTASVSRYSKWRGLRELERRGLLSVQERPKRSPIVRLHHV